MRQIKEAAFEVIKEHSEGITHPQLVTAMRERGYGDEGNFSERLYHTVISMVKDGLVRKNPETRAVMCKSSPKRRKQFAMCH